jgi:hypothetical protein
MAKYGAIIGLALLAAVQLAVLGSRQGSAGAAPGTWLGVGDSVAQIRVLDSTGREFSLATGEPTLLLVFDSQCGHCQTVAPVWRGWIRASGSGLSLIAVSSEPLASAQDFVAEHGWAVEVRTVEAGRLGSRGHALTGRIPWVFAVDGAGVIVAEGHGRRIAELAAALIAPHKGAEGA